MFIFALWQSYMIDLVKKESNREYCKFMSNTNFKTLNIITMRNLFKFKVIIFLLAGLLLLNACKTEKDENDNGANVNPNRQRCATSHVKATVYQLKPNGYLLPKVEIKAMEPFMPEATMSNMWLGMSVTVHAGFVLSEQNEPMNLAFLT